MATTTTRQATGNKNRVKSVKLIDISLKRPIHGATPCSVIMFSYVIGRCKNMVVKAGTSIHTGLPALLAHLVCLTMLLALLFY
jgi:hypothetical protein